MSPKQQRALLGDVLISNGVPLSNNALSLVDRVMEHEARATERPQPLTITPQDLGSGTVWQRHGATNLVVWKGDMLRLEVDAMVNAANEQRLGCFQPSHRCIDNILHRGAGPRLRESCRETLSQRPVGQRCVPCGGKPLVTFIANAAWALRLYTPWGSTNYPRHALMMQRAFDDKS